MNRKSNKIALLLTAALIAVCLATALVACTSAHEHKWGEWSFVTEPDCTNAGERVRECSVCHEKETEPVSPLGHDWDHDVLVPAFIVQPRHRGQGEFAVQALSRLAFKSSHTRDGRAQLPPGIPIGRQLPLARVRGLRQSKRACAPFKHERLADQRRLSLSRLHGVRRGLCHDRAHFQRYRVRLLRQGRSQHAVHRGLGLRAHL